MDGRRCLERKRKGVDIEPCGKAQWTVAAELGIRIGLENN